MRRFVIAEGYIDVEKDLLGNDACWSRIFGDAVIDGFFGEMFVVPSAILPEPRRGLALKSLCRAEVRMINSRISGLDKPASPARHDTSNTPRRDATTSKDRSFRRTEPAHGS